MLDRQMIYKKVDEITVFDIFVGDISYSLTKIKQLHHKHGDSIQLIVDESNPMQINVLKGRYETDAECLERKERTRVEKAHGVQFKKRKLMEHLITEFGNEK